MPTLLLTAGAVIDAAGAAFASGAMVLEVDSFEGVAFDAGGPPTRHCTARCVTVGPLASVLASMAAAADRRIDLPGAILVPGLVNAHTHLDLTAVGPREHEPSQGFAGFAQLVMRERPRDEAGVRDAVRRGVLLSLQGGVVAVGDIGGMVTPALTTWAAAELAASPLMGTAFPEFFAIAKASADRLDATLAPAREPSLTTPRVRMGLSPHAPYSVGPRGYAKAMDLRRELRLPLTTHLAESTHERAAVTHARGPAVDLLKSLGLFDAEAQAWLGHAPSPVQRLADTLARAREADQAPLSLVHCNDVSDADIELIVASGASVIYCPRSSEYFGADQAFGPHRYRELLARGVNVALGTDSIINLPLQAPPRISTWDEARRLHQRDGTDARTLLAMATTHGARAIGLPPSAFTFSPGRPLAGVVAMEVQQATGQTPMGILQAAFDEHAAPRLLVLGSLI
ncbi:MAG: amidohydrolase family protein [Phycisphaerales bacterium]|nr:amidohydrolase family protein [Phycisphaerales bacterium]